MRAMSRILELDVRFANKRSSGVALGQQVMGIKAETQPLAKLSANRRDHLSPRERDLLV
jgi:hypothetical protein